jgi:conjugative transfer region protein (TIGR03748 family)
MNKISKVIILSLMVGAAYSADTQMSRYTTMKESVPIKKVDLLQQNITINFSPNVRTIDDALKQLLVNSGYQLETTASQDKYTQAMLANNLPATQRVIENASLKQSLLALTGDQFDIVVDPINRIISFKIKPTVLAIYLNEKGSTNGQG